MNKKECLAANWQDLGFYDGNRGKALSFLDERAKDCAKHGIIADRQTYLVAREKGLVTYCTKEKGYAVGYQGDRYLGVCHGAAEERFLSGYNRGKRIYDQKQVVSKLKNKLRTIERDIRAKRDELLDLEEQLVLEDDKAKRAILASRLLRVRHSITQLTSDKEDTRDEYHIEQLNLSRLL